MQKVVPSLLALRRSNPEGLAWLLTEHRVKRGITWLKRNAIAGWHRNLFEPQQNGRSRFRAKDAYGNECVLALAFEHRADLADIEGYVKFATVARHYRLSNPHLLGFCTAKIDHVEFRSYPGVHMSSALLDREWERILRLGGLYLHTTRQYSLRERQLSLSAARTDGPTCS